jgi:phosphoglycerate dehydrogenase-like enzyme
MANQTLRVGVTRDALLDGGKTFFDPAALKILDGAREIAWEYLPEPKKTLTADDAAKYDVISVVAAGIGADAFGRADQKLKLVAGFGAGYDNRDVKALTANGVLLTNNPDAVRRPMATTQLTFILALAHKLLIKDRLTRTGRWADQRQHYGVGLSGRTLGSLGLGNIASEMFKLARPLDMKFIAHDPYAKPEHAAQLGVTLVDYDTLFRESDFVCVNVLLNDSTRKLVGEKAFSLMKPTAYFISAARGPIVDEAAMYKALKENRIAGAGIDVWEQEPTPPDNPILKLDNVIVSPHSLCHTDECNRLLAEGSFKATTAYARREVPPRTVNREALEHPRQKAWFGK